MIINSIVDIASPPLFFHLQDFIDQGVVFLKLEGLNIAGSIKLTTAKGLIESLEKQGKISSHTKIIESSSGNLGVALSIVCKEKHYPFICVTDPNILPENEKLMKIYGATVIKVTERDSNGGYLASRIQYIHKLLESDPDYVWLNQYANSSNPLAHYHKTAQDILTEFPHIDYLFVGAGTTGTLMGCAAFFKKHSPQTKIIAVDAVGSVTFGFPPKKRYIPGLGTSRSPEIADKKLVDDILLIEETDTVKMCWWMLEKYGLFLGGSSGTVLEGIKQYASQIPPQSTVVAISPDFGHKYLEMIYNELWIQEKYQLTLADVSSIAYR